MENESQILKNITNRKERFRPNSKLDNLISCLKAQLEPIQLQRNREFIAPKKPVLIIVGCPRSGTTLLTQLLAATSNFAYPTNFLSRFAYAPELGAMIQEMLFNKEYDFLDELSDVVSSYTFTSNLGRTSGVLQINQFFHFWRKFFPNHDPRYLTPEELKLVDIVRMRSELASIEHIFNKSFMSKGMMLQYNIRFFAEQVPEFIFLYIKRQPKFIMQSLLLARRQYYGTDQIWYSVKPKEYLMLSQKNPIYQVAGQVLFTERAIEEQLTEISDDRKIICDYENLCSNPNDIYDQLRNIFHRNNYDINEYHFSESFPCGNVIKTSQEEIKKLETAYEEMKNL